MESPWTARTILDAAKELPVAAEVDVLVCGGGVTGVAAAVCAARSGAKTLLVERSSSLGGTATAAMMAVIVVPFSCLHAYPREFFSRLAELGGSSNEDVVTFDPELYKLAAIEFLDRAGADVLLYTTTSDVIKDGNTLRGVIVENKSGRQAILARTVIDATGDADVAAAAGVLSVKGREGDQKMRPISLLFRIGGVNVDAIQSYVAAHREDFSPDPGRCIVDPDREVIRLDGYYHLVEDAQNRGELPREVNYLRLVGRGHGEVIVNSVRVYGVDGTNARDLTRADLEGRRQMMRILTFLNKWVPGFQKAHLINASESLGVRETRRIRGEYLLTEEDLVTQRPFIDSIARIYSLRYAGLAVHSPDGGEGGHGDRWAREDNLPLTWFNFPYRALVPVGVENLLVAGRSISATHRADTWTRGQNSCMHQGQAAGVAAALAARGGVPPRAIPIERLQQLLIEQGVDVGTRHAGDPSPPAVISRKIGNLSNI